MNSHAQALALRLVQSAVVIALVVVISFVTFRWIPGDPARAFVGAEGSTEVYERVRAEFGLDRPLREQFAEWVTGIAQGDLGHSFRSGDAVAPLVLRRLAVTAQLILVSLLITVAVGVPAGVLAGAREASVWDKASALLFSAALALPSFWLALLLVSVFAVRLDLLPAYGFVEFADGPIDWAKSIALPAVALSAASTAVLGRTVRAGTVDVMRTDYIRTARSKGLRPSIVLFRHSFPNIAVPAMSVVGIIIVQMLSGAIVVEVIFGFPGIGRLTVDAVLFRDFPVVQGVVLVLAFVTVGVNALIDLAYWLLSPSLRSRS